MTWRNENTQQIKTLVDGCYKKGKLLCGICDASAFLGTVGVLNDVMHTSNDINDLKQWAGTIYTGETKYNRYSMKIFHYKGGNFILSLQ